MNITVRHRARVDVLRKQPESISRFGLVAKEINKILYKHGFEMISAVPHGSLELDMAYVDLHSQELYDHPSEYPLELQLALYEVDTLDILIEDEEVIRATYKELDIEAEYNYQKYGWADELLGMWGLAARSANISLKQIRVAINSVSGSLGVNGVAYMQYIKNTDTEPILESIPLRTIDEFIAACEELDEKKVEVVNVVINKPVPRTKSIIPLSYAITPGKYVNMKLRGE